MCRPSKSLRNSQTSCIIDGWVVLSKVKEAPESQYLRGGGNDGGDAGKVDEINGVDGDEVGL